MCCYFFVLIFGRKAKEKKVGGNDVRMKSAGGINRRWIGFYFITLLQKVLSGETNLIRGLVWDFGLRRRVVCVARRRRPAAAAIFQQPGF